MLLNFFTEEAYERLYGDYKENKEKYKGTDEWVPTYFGNGVKWYGQSTQEVEQFRPFYSDEADRSKDDFENARRLYNAFKKLTPLQATNKYMWAYLCHMDKECRKYMQYRWENSENLDQKYFVPGSGMGLYYHNGLSRLWWWAHLTYDEENKNTDPYRLTRILFENQMLGKDILDTLNRNNFNRIKGILLAIQDFKEILNPSEAVTGYFRECKKELNQQAAISMFDYLDSEDIRKITYNELVKVRNAQKSSN